MEKNLTLKLNLEELSKNKKEFKRYLYAIYSMEIYAYSSWTSVQKMMRDYQLIGQKYLDKLSFDYRLLAQKFKEAIEYNQKFLYEIIKIYKPPASYYKDIDMNDIYQNYYSEGQFLVHSLFYTTRDWTAERANERKNSYGLIVEEALKRFSPKSQSCKVLIPGSSLNRLGYELCENGFDVEANDYLYLNAIFSDFTFNHTTKNKYTYFPLRYNSLNNRLSEKAVFHEFSFPDVDINLNQSGKGKIAMTVGDFTEIYKNRDEEFDCVITCFFIDTAQNVLEYVDIIQKILKKGGIWINFGPLSYHYVYSKDKTSIELPYDTLKQCIINFGFDFLSESVKQCLYCEIEEGMKNDVFNCIFFTAQKK